MLLGLPFAALSQESNATLSNPYTSSDDIAGGQRAFLSQCAACHGADGRGGNAGPDLSVLKRASSDESLYQIINKGIPGTVMPGSSSNTSGIWQLVAYVRSIAANRQVKASGNARRGEDLYRQHGCARCHQTTAPELFTLARTRSPLELRNSILQPQVEVGDAYWSFRAKLASGATVSGQRLNEDSETIQYRTPEGQLRSLRRQQIEEITWDRTSPMPTYADKLNSADIDDLIAYLLEGRN
ncbi:MAG: c-type cytochrome [Bryobacter sp.]|nr:c-type cytochrome [Bryobacter sp.]